MSIVQVFFYSLVMSQQKLERLKNSYLDISDNFEIGWNIFLEQKNNLLWFLLILNLPIAIIEQFVPDPDPQGGFDSPFIIPFFIVAMLIGIIINLAIHILTEKSIMQESSQAIFTLKKVSSKVLIALLTGILFFIMVFLGSLFFLIPGIYLGVIFAFFTEAIALRNCQLDAFNYSRNLVKGQFWKVFGRLLILGVSLVILVLFITVPIGFISVVLNNLPIISFIISVISSLIIVAINYLFVIIFTVYFLNLDYLRNGLPQRV
ncbi:hypothetical protein FRE64_15525 [Euhalothece natronophila Z-M001]|uniref:Glycerophosphoryl diester phosphodiesterase membrane domain-containing protein n=1 Tax=Euhalothece natronophila Z-M001 TaxID=522448 RepID=A0A5B8NQF3_9CHRO|nr:hypothetical protein [Euhalothece natronophila]QDZ41226.1 hypothetical protein FRE64_15525 [Euhalothece natronophila Z-M001]